MKSELRINKRENRFKKSRCEYPWWTSPHNGRDRHLNYDATLNIILVFVYVWLWQNSIVQHAIKGTRYLKKWRII